MKKSKRKLHTYEADVIREEIDTVKVRAKNKRNARKLIERDYGYDYGDIVCLKRKT